MKPIFACCAAPAFFTIQDYADCPWTFEATRMFGPVVLNKDGKPRRRQPGSRSSFWPAWDAWAKRIQETA